MIFPQLFKKPKTLATILVITYLLFMGVTFKVNQLYQRLDGVESTAGELSSRLSEFAGSVNELESEVEDLKSEVSDMENRRWLH